MMQKTKILFLFLFCVPTLLVSQAGYSQQKKENKSENNLHLKEYSVYGHIGIINFRNTENITSQLSPSFTAGVSRIIFAEVNNEDAKSLRVGIEYSHANYYFDLHYQNGGFDKAAPNIEVLELSANQITIPLVFSYGIPKKNNMVTISAGIFGSYIFNVSEKYKDNSAEKTMSINNGFNTINAGGEFLIGWERLFEKKVMFEPFSKFDIGSRYSLLGISRKNNVCIPIEAFIRISLF